MPKLTFAATRPVNPPGASPKITEAQLWKGLEKKAREPANFIPGVQESSVLKDEGNKVVRKVTFKTGEEIEEIIDIHPNTVIYFDSNKGHRIINLVSYDSSGEPQLTFSFTGGVPGMPTPPEGTPLPPTEVLNEKVGGGVNGTLEVIRELVRKGEL